MLGSFGQMNAIDEVHYRKALAAFHANRLEEARECLGRVAISDARDHKVAHLAGVVALTQGALSEAQGFFRTALRYAQTTDAMAASCVGLGRAFLPDALLDKALAYFQRALDLKPDFAPALSGAAAAYCDIGDYRRAEGSAREALSLVDDPRTRLVLARVLLFQSRIDEAETVLRTLVSIPETEFMARFHLAGCSGARGRSEEAENDFRALLNEQPEYPGYYELAKQKKFASRNDPDLLKMQKVSRMISEDENRLSVALHVDLCFAKAKAYQDLGCAEKAFENLRMGNATRAKSEAFDLNAFEMWSLEMARIGRELAATKMARKCPHAVPLVIAALPRSGSTLLEQMLIGHPVIAGNGEYSTIIPVLDELVEKVGSLEKLRRAKNTERYAAWINKATDQLVSLLGGYAPNVRYVTETSPVAFIYAGIVTALLSGCRVIHMRRHPLDVALSQFSHNFVRGLGWTYQLEDIAGYHKVYARIVETLRMSVDDRILDVYYEELVHDAPGQLRKILDFCGLAYDPACEKFDERARPVWTASSAQVRERLNRGSIGRWRQYQRHLEPLKEEMAAEITEYENYLRRNSVPF